jgi:hypothetical protein
MFKTVTSFSNLGIWILTGSAITRRIESNILQKLAAFL